MQFVDVLPQTPDGKVHLFPEALEHEAPLGLYRFQPDPATQAFPLALISPASDRTISSTLGELPRPAVKLVMHPADAVARGLERRRCRARLQRAGRGALRPADRPVGPPGRRVAAQGPVAQEHANSNTATTLAPDTLTDIAGGACFNDARVEVQKT